MRLPEFDVYCSNTTGHNALRFQLGSITVWFSYQTPVAYQVPGSGIVVRENDWGPTTGKHLNAIDGGGQSKASRVSGEVFERALEDALKGAVPCP